MSIEEYRNFKYMVDAYLELRDENLLKEIRKIIDTKKSIRRQLIKELDNNERYIEVFCIEDQVKIGINILNRESHRKYSTYKTVWILFYMSNKAIGEILKNVDSKALNDVIYEIKNIVKNDYRNMSEYFKPRTNKKFSKIGLKRAFKKLYRKCSKFE